PATVYLGACRRKLVGKTRPPSVREGLGRDAPVGIGGDGSVGGLAMFACDGGKERGAAVRHDPWILARATSHEARTFDAEATRRRDVLPPRESVVVHRAAHAAGSASSWASAKAAVRALGRQQRLQVDRDSVTVLRRDAEALRRLHRRHAALEGRRPAGNPLLDPQPRTLLQRTGLELHADDARCDEPFGELFD